MPELPVARFKALILSPTAVETLESLDGDGECLAPGERVRVSELDSSDLVGV